jgi:Fe-S cluster biogenesis protein NfuA
LPSHNPEFERKRVKKREGLSPELAAIEEILDRTIRPGLQADGGDVEVLNLEGNILTIKYEGACGTCPSSMAGTLQAITSFIRDEFDPEIEVVAM